MHRTASWATTTWLLLAGFALVSGLALATPDPAAAGIFKRKGPKPALVEELVDSEPQAFPSPKEIEPLVLGSALPDAIVYDLEGQTTPLREALGGRPTVLIFFQGSWCPYCLRQLSELRKIEDQLTALGFQMVAMSPDRWDYIESVRDKRDLQYKLYSDSSMSAARAFGVAHKVSGKMGDSFRGLGLDLSDYHGEDHGELPVPSVFVIDADARIRFVYANPNIRERADPEVLLSAARDVAP